MTSERLPARAALRSPARRIQPEPH